MDFNENKLEKTIFKQTHMKACRNALGIRANASGMAAKAELGRYPLIIYLVKQSLKFYSKTMTEERKLACNPLVSEIELHNMGKHSWITTINKICNTATKQSHTQGLTNIQKVVQSLKDNYQEQFFKGIWSTTGINHTLGNKLRTYASIKQEYKQEDYTTANLSRNMMVGITQLRTRDNIYTPLNFYFRVVIILYFLPLWLLFINENGGLYFTITPSLFDVITLYVAMVCLL